jgi:hypothetical protein
MNSIDDIDEILSKQVKMPIDKPVVNMNPTGRMTIELRDMRESIESILIFLKITDRMSEAQYRFVFNHVHTTKPNEGEELDDFLTRSAMELEEKMKNMGLLRK